MVIVRGVHVHLVVEVERVVLGAGGVCKRELVKRSVRKLARRREIAVAVGTQGCRGSREAHLFTRYVKGGMQPLERALVKVRSPQFG
jgi:hypothetical protein